LLRTSNASINSKLGSICKENKKTHHGKKPHLRLYGPSFAQGTSTEVTDPSHGAAEQKLPEIKQASRAETFQELSGKREYQNDGCCTLLARIGQLQLHDHPEKVVPRLSHVGQWTTKRNHEK